MRNGKPGSAWDESQRARHEADCVSLLKRKSTEDEEVGKKLEKAKKAKLEGKIDGLASLDCAGGIADTVQILRKETIEQFRTVGPLPLDVIPKTLVLTMDFLQLQFRVAWFLRHQLQMNVEPIVEITHRRMNDINLAMDSRVWIQRKYAAYICIQNIYCVCTPSLAILAQAQTPYVFEVRMARSLLSRFGASSSLGKKSCREFPCNEFRGKTAG